MTTWGGPIDDPFEEDRSTLQQVIDDLRTAATGVLDGWLEDVMFGDPGLKHTSAYVALAKAQIVAASLLLQVAIDALPEEVTS